MNKGRYAATLAVALVLSTMSSPPALAVTPSSEPLSGLLDWLNQQIAEIENYANGILQDKAEALTEALGSEFDGIVGDAAGVLGLPDPSQTRQASEEAAAASEGAIYAGDRAANEIDRQTTRASAAGILSQEGQQQQKAVYEQTQQAVDAVQQASDLAQTEVVTQNVMKQIAIQNAQTAKVMGSVQSNLLKSNEQQAQTNTQLTNISRTLDGQTQLENADRVGVGFSNLRITSQAGLF
ncbi:hypothetical protein [Coleofasciculus sp. E2-BRE-01]|jgi:hypothetical protein|uniref:hypothetical protein n=1 Tax=Coleofasciculus sp. E2-BRE-01 TaxID=3069524 RepID=UPI0032FBCFF1